MLQINFLENALINKKTIKKTLVELNRVIPLNMSLVLNTDAFKDDMQCDVITQYRYYLNHAGTHSILARWQQMSLFKQNVNALKIYSILEKQMNVLFKVEVYLFGYSSSLVSQQISY